MRYPLNLRQTITGTTQRVVAWPPTDSHPLYREHASETKQHSAADLRLALRLAAITALIAAGIGLGHGITASTESFASPVSAADAASPIEDATLTSASAITAALHGR